MSEIFLPVTATGVVMPRWLATGLVSGALLALVATSNELLLDPPAAEAVEEIERALEFDSDGDGVPDRPDRISAGLLAVDLDVAVEDMSARTESATEVVNPDGTITVEDFGGPVRIASETTDPETGEETTAWTPVDYTLSELPGGRWAPAASPATVVVNGNWNNKDEAARVEFEDGSAVAISWPAGTTGLDGNGDGILPTPTIDGATATYALEGYSGSVDLVIGMTTAGVTALLRINEELTAEETAVIEAQGVTFGIRTVGPKSLSTGADAIAADPSIEPEVPGGSDGNGLVVTDAEGALVGATPELQAWENSVVDDMGVPAETVLLETALETVGTTGSGAERVVAHELTVTPPEGFLTDAATEYPVVLDPEIQSLTQTADTWVRNGINGTNGSDASLLVGKAQSLPNNPAYSYLLFNGHSLTGKGIVRAELGMYQYQAGSCGAKNLYVHAVSGTWSESTTTWANQPGVNGSGFTTVTANRGSTCSNGMGYTTANVTPIVQNWADYQADNAYGYVNRGFRLGAPSTGDTTFERRFCSMNYNSTTAPGCVGNKPYLKVTYNGAPVGTKQPMLQAGVGRTWGGVLTVSTGRPTFETTSVDEDGTPFAHTIEARTSQTATTRSSSCVTPAVKSGENSWCRLNTALANGGTYWVRAQAEDEFGQTSAWSKWRQIRINNNSATVTTHSCATVPGAGQTATAVTNGQWYSERPGERVKCTVTGNNLAGVRWMLNGAQPVETLTGAAGGAAGTATFEFDVPEVGWTSLEARGFTTANAFSAPVTYAFGTGEAALNEPIADTTSSTTFPIQATAPQGANGAKVQWRVAPLNAEDTGGWVDATGVLVASTGSSWNGSLISPPAGTSYSQTPRLLWDARTESSIELGAVVQMRVRFAYPGGNEPKATPFERVHVIKSAFGENNPVQAVGPVTVALATGEMALSGTDIEVPGYGDPIKVGRNHLSLAGETTGPQSVFGPGWSGDFPGPETGSSGYSVDDRTAVDGTLQLNDGAGNIYAYGHSSNTRGFLKPGTYVGIGETAYLEDKVTLIAVTSSTDPGSTDYGVSHRLTVVDIENSTTTYKRISTGNGFTWVTESVSEPVTNSTTRYAYNSDATTAWILAPTPAGVTCSLTSGTTSAPPAAVLNTGCRALEMTYTGTTTGPGGDKRLAEVKLHAYDPKPGADGLPTAAAGMVSVSVAKYAYEPSGDRRLLAAWDPRLGDGAGALKAEFTYNTLQVGSSTKHVLSTVAEPGLVPWRFAYDSQGRLETVKRAHPSEVGTGDATWRVKYDVPLNGSGLPDLREAATASWGQQAADAPTYATAVFEPDYTGGASPSGTEWQWGSISYFDRRARTTNSAVFGAGEWLVSTVRYDAKDNTIWELDSEGRSRALAENPDNAVVSAAAADLYASHTIYDVDGTRVEAAYSPSVEMVLDNGETILGRTLTETLYDDEVPASQAAELMPGRPTSGVPNGGYDLEIEETASVVESTAFPVDASTVRHDLTRSRNRYDALTSTDGDGWFLKSPTRVLVEDSAVTSGPTPGWAVSLTRVDKDGNIIETRPPGVTATSGGLQVSSNDPRTTKTIYYAAGANSANAACGNRPQWAGLVCAVAPGGQPSTGMPIPTEYTTGYSILTAPLREEERAGSASSELMRSVVTQLDDKQRPRIETTTQSAALGGGSLSSVTNYSAQTGDIVSVESGEFIGETTYDSWGRVVTQRDGKQAAVNESVTTYDLAGNVVKLNDGKGEYRYAYDGLDALGRVERRGLITSLDTGFDANGERDVITAAYNQDGRPVLQNYPGGYSAETVYDMDGNVRGLTYKQTRDGTAITVLGFANTYDSEGRVRTAAGPDGVATYAYDSRDRLVRVEDLNTAGALECTTRTYTFTPDSNRTAMSSFPGPNGQCQTSSGQSTFSTEFDNADRISGGVVSGYVYDGLGRTTVVPKAHTDQAVEADAGNLTVAYHPDDMVKTLTQSTVVSSGSQPQTRSQTFELDGSGRISGRVTTTGAVEVEKYLHRYAGEEDSPAWTQVSQRLDSSQQWVTSWDRNIKDVAGSLSLTQNSSGNITLNLANTHGDVAATVSLGANAAEPGIVESYVGYTEYGAAKQNLSGSGRYGWLGTHQRESRGVTGGFTLMGARAYNPVTGRFLTPDPVRGGNDNTYAYPADPINQMDLDGEWGMPKWAKKAAKKMKKVAKKAAKFVRKHKWDIALTAAGFIPGVGAAAWAVRGYRAYKGYKALKAAKAARGALKLRRSSRVRSVKSRRGSSGNRCSFSGDTVVRLFSGESRPIDEVRVGDVLLATDPETGAQGPRAVEHVWLHDDQLYVIRIGGEELSITEDHPVWSVDAGRFKAAQELTVGEHVLAADGSSARVESEISAVDVGAAFNLEVEGIHTFHVGLGATLVHNKCRAPNAKNKRDTQHPQTFQSREAAIRRARQDAADGGARCYYRGQCSPNGNHVHVDYKNKHGEIMETRHYVWRR